jgi:hypothetical protein
MKQFIEKGNRKKKSMSFLHRDCSYFAVYVMIRLTCSIIVINNVDEQLICIDKFGSILVSIFDRCRCFRLRSDYWNCFGKVI